MDYLRTLGSAAVSSLVQKSGLNLPFSLGSKVTSFENLWNLYDGTKRDDGSPVSIFEYDNRNSMPLAKNAVRKLRTTRHPDVLKFIDAVESDTVVYIVTERVKPLSTSLPAWSSRDAREREDWLLWGLHRISVALSFVNDSCASTHGNIRIHSCFISPSGEWKLGGFELLSTPQDEAAVLYTLGGTVPRASDWVPPEVRKGGYAVLKEQQPAAADAYSLGLLLHAVFNPTHGPPATSLPPHPAPQPSSRGSIPTSVFPSFKRLLNPNAKARLSPQNFLALGMAETAGEGSGFFISNKLVRVCMGLDNFSLGSEAEKTELLRMLKDSASTFPAEFASYRVLPSLISALEFEGASASAILPLVLQLGNNVSPEDYPSVVLAPIIKLFANPDRGTRMALLDHLPKYADKLDKKAVANKIWPHLQTGFSDTVPAIREATVKSISLLSEKFNDRILNNDLLRFLAKMQSDPEASIRTNTCILIGRLGPSLGYNTKRKVLVPAFTRALKDPFVHARVAGLMAFMATIDCFDIEELGTKAIPNISPVLIDTEKLVRDQAFKAVELFVRKLEAHAATMPTTAIPNDAIVSDRPASAPPPSSPAILDGGANSLRPPASTASSTPTLMGKGLQLGTNKATANIILAAQLAEEAAAREDADNTAWGPGDLMDVNADQDDWSTFETAPVAEPNHLSDDLNVAFIPGGFESSSQSIEGTDDNNLATNLWSTNLRNGISSSESIVLDPWRSSALSGAAFSVDLTSGNTYPTAPAQGRNVSMPRTSSSQRPTPASSPPPSFDISQKVTQAPAVLPSGGMSKEEKAAEIARRKEERKQRIAQLKEQKKNSSNMS